MKILVIGGFGYLGSYCAELFYKDGNEVTLLGRKVPSYMKDWVKKFKLILGDICDIDLKHKIKDRFDLIIHFASINDQLSKNNSKVTIETNVFGTKNILDICNEKDIEKLVYISTFHVYGLNAVNTIDETTEPLPINDYGITHYFSEIYCKQYSTVKNMNCIVLRPANFYTGPLFKEINRWSLVPNNFIKQAVEENKIIINSSGKQLRNFISIVDLYNAINEAMGNKSIKGFNIFNVGSNYNYTINHIAEIVQKAYLKLTGKNIEIKNTISDDNEIPKNFTYDISKLLSLQWAPINNLQEEVTHTISSLITYH
jgi:UDP-glucose 4-epimerase